MNSPTTPATAILDGTLCRLDARGRRIAAHPPLATAIVEFLPGPLRTYVRENPLGLLPGIANLYCVDAALRLQWVAEWPFADDPCAAILGEENEVLAVLSVSGATLHFDAHTGRRVADPSTVAVAS